MREDCIGIWIIGVGSGIHLQNLKQQEQTKDILKNDWRDLNNLPIIPIKHNNRIRKIF